MGNDNARAALKRLLERAESTDRDEGMTYEDPLDIEVNGKYVDVLFTTGGPHIEVQLEFDRGCGGEFWFEDAPVRGLLTWANWFEHETVPLNGEEAWLIQSAILRDPDDPVFEDDEEDEDDPAFEEPANGSGSAPADDLTGRE